MGTEGQTDLSARPGRRWFQFSLKWLMAAVLLFSLPRGWLAVKVQQKQQERIAVAKLQELGVTVLYDWQAVGFEIPLPPGPAWLRRLLGDDFFANVNERRCIRY